MIVFFLIGVFAALFFVAKLLLPEMAKPPLPKAVAKPRPMEPIEIDSRIEKLESLLAEKNKDIAFLQTELKIFHTEVCEFDKLKSMLEEEIRRLRQQNRIFRSELGLPAVQPQIQEGPLTQNS